jgi:hypothetical protein
MPARVHLHEVHRHPEVHGGQIDEAVCRHLVGNEIASRRSRWRRPWPVRFVQELGGQHTYGNQHHLRRDHTHPKSHEGRGVSTEAGQASPGVAAQYRRQTPEQLDTFQGTPSQPRPAHWRSRAQDAPRRSAPTRSPKRCTAGPPRSMDTGHAGVRTVTSDLPPSTKGPDEHPRRSLKKKACPQ